MLQNNGSISEAKEPRSMNDETRCRSSYLFYSKKIAPQDWNRQRSGAVMKPCKRGAAVIAGT